MDKKYAKKYFLVEEKHWWFKARKDIILKLMNQFDKNTRILDVGCSGGVLIDSLKKKGFKNVYGIDINKTAVNICVKKRLKNVKIGLAESTKYPKEFFDVIVSSDLLEHIRKEDSALSEWSRILKKNGKLLIFVPAFNFLWSNHDRINHHYRRYTKRSLTTALMKNKFSIKKINYWNFSFFIPASIIKMFMKITHNERMNQISTPKKIINNLAEKLLKIENRLILKNINPPLGVSVFAIAQKNHHSYLNASTGAKLFKKV